MGGRDVKAAATITEKLHSHSSMQLSATKMTIAVTEKEAATIKASAGTI